MEAKTPVPLCFAHFANVLILLLAHFLITKPHDLQNFIYLLFREYELRPEFVVLGITPKNDHPHRSDGWSLPSTLTEFL